MNPVNNHYSVMLMETSAVSIIAIGSQLRMIAWTNRIADMMILTQYASCVH